VFTWSSAVVWNGRFKIQTLYSIEEQYGCSFLLVLANPFHIGSAVGQKWSAVHSITFVLILTTEESTWRTVVGMTVTPDSEDLGPT
jgi:hypothetical protein